MLAFQGEEGGGAQAHVAVVRHGEGQGHPAVGDAVVVPFLDAQGAGLDGGAAVVPEEGPGPAGLRQAGAAVQQRQGAGDLMPHDGVPPFLWVKWGKIGLSSQKAPPVRRSGLGREPVRLRGATQIQGQGPPLFLLLTGREPWAFPPPLRRCPWASAGGALSAGAPLSVGRVWMLTAAASSRSMLFRGPWNGSVDSPPAASPGRPGRGPGSASRRWRCCWRRGCCAGRRGGRYS